MKKLLFIAFAIMMVGCRNRTREQNISIDEGSLVNPYIRVIDSCEYVNWGYGMAHKGNCKYCQERRKQEIRELIKAIKSE